MVLVQADSQYGHEIASGSPRLSVVSVPVSVSVPAFPCFPVGNCSGFCGQHFSPFTKWMGGQNDVIIKFSLSPASKS